MPRKKMETTVGRDGMTSEQIRKSSEIESVEVVIRRKGSRMKFAMVGPRLGDQLRKIADECDRGCK